MKRFLVWGAAALTAALFLTMIAYLTIKGIPHLKSTLFALNYTSENVSLLPAAVNTLLMTVLALALALPFGIGAAVYTCEYARRGNRFVGIVRVEAKDEILSLLHFASLGINNLQLVTGIVDVHLVAGHVLYVSHGP